MLVEFKGVCRAKDMSKNLCPNKISSTESLRLLYKVFGELFLCKTKACKWNKAFKEDREVFTDLSCFVRSSTYTTDENLKKKLRLIIVIRV